jgi:hypothetical protein
MKNSFTEYNQLKYLSIMLQLFIYLYISNTVVKVKVTIWYTYASGCIAPTHSQPGTGRRWVVITTLRPLYPSPRERPGTHCTGGWVGLGAGKSHPTGIRSPDRLAYSESLYDFSNILYIYIYILVFMLLRVSQRSYHHQASVRSSYITLS